MDNRTIIQRSLDYIENNLQAEIEAAELAEMAGFSLFHYYRLFREATGMPVMQYILRRRLLHGVYAMKQGCGKTDAALRFGFDTYAGFYKAFCREFGATPSVFLGSCRAKRPYRIGITREEHMTVTHKKAAQILQNWNLSDETITDIYYEGTGNKNDSAMLREVLRQIGDRPVYLWAFKENTRARQFYEKHGSAGWELDTILQETGNCHLYEKMGYRRTAQCTVINDKMTLVGYEKA